jgi:hypothetical protein
LKVFKGLRFFRKKIPKLPWAALSFVVKFFAVVFCVALVGVAVFFSNAGREALLWAISKYFQRQNVEVKITGLNGSMTKIKEIFLKTPSKTELVFSNISLRRKDSPSNAVMLSVDVEKFVMHCPIASRTEFRRPRPGDSSSGSGEVDCGKKPLCNGLLHSENDNYTPIVGLVHRFVPDIAIGKAELNNVFGRNYALDELAYRHRDGEDNLHAKINNEHVLDACLQWRENKCVRCAISFEKILGFSGQCCVELHPKAVSNYKFAVHRDDPHGDLQMEGNGDYGDFMSAIALRNCRIAYNNKICSVTGTLRLKSQTAHLATAVRPKDFLVGQMPPRLLKIFDDVIADCEIDCDFGANTLGKAKIVLGTFNRKSGILHCILHKNILNIVGNMEGIDFFGFAPKDIRCRLEDFKMLEAEIKTSDFSIFAAAKLSKIPSIERLRILVGKNGVMQSLHPFLLDGNSPIDGDFSLDNLEFLGKFDNLDFLRKNANISGDAKGSFSYKNGTLTGKCQSKNLRFNGNEFRDLDFSRDDTGVKLTAEQAKIFSADCEKLYADVVGDSLNIKANVNKKYKFSASGTAADFRRKISLTHCCLKSPDVEFNLKTCEINLADSSCEILCHLTTKNSRLPGIANLSKTNNEISVALESWSMHDLLALLNCQIPSCKCSGKIQLKTEPNIVSGHGELLVSDFGLNRNAANVIFDLLGDGIRVASSICGNHRCPEDRLNVTAFIPVALKPDGGILKFSNAQTLNCRLFGDINLEHILEPSDKNDVRGAINCDLTLSGSLDHPRLSGFAKLQKALFSLDDLLLKNGQINLIARNKDLLISNSYFTDKYGKKLMISGGGSISTDQIIPGLQTNIALKANNFLLFDGESYSISIRGNAKISGPLDDMLLAGNITVPTCKIQKFYGENAEKGDILIENERNVERRQTEHSKSKNPFKYDVKMRCPRIVISGQGFLVEMLGDLRLLTHENRVTMNGSVKLKNGSVDLLGKRMKIIKGYASFDENFPFDPTAQFLCEKSFDDFVAYLEITNHPQTGVSTNLFSIPNYSKDIVLSKMLFGKELRYLSGTEAAQLAHTMANINHSGYIFSFFNIFQKIGIVDSISFTKQNSKSQASLISDNKSDDSRGGVNVSAGKYIGENIYVSVNKSAESASLDVNIALTPSIAVEANTNGETGISWRYRY